VTCRYAIPTQVSANTAITSLEDIFERAIAHTVLEHPLLQVGMIDEDSKKPSWVRLDSISLRDHVEWMTVADNEDYDGILRGILENRHSIPFANQESKPPWRLVVLKTTNLAFLEIVFTWNHAVGDGKAGKFFHETLLEKLNTVSDGNSTVTLKDHVFEIPVVSAFTPALEHLLKFPLSPGFLVSEGWKAVRPPFLTFPSRYSATWAPIRLEPYKTRLSLIEIEHDKLQSVLGLCRSHKTTLTGLISALSVVSLATRLSEEQASEFQVGTPICLRRFIPPSPPGFPGLQPNQTVGNFIAYWPYVYDGPAVAKVRQQVAAIKKDANSARDAEATLWSIAKEFREALSQKLESRTKNDDLGLTKLVGDWRPFFADELKKPRKMSSEVSNLGELDGANDQVDEKDGPEQGWTIERALFSQSAVVLGPAICISTITVKNKMLTVVCSWQDGIVDDGLAEGFSSDLRTWLNGLGEKGHIPFENSE
jgi:hypothetical protein